MPPQDGAFSPTSACPRTAHEGTASFCLGPLSSFPFSTSVVLKPKSATESPQHLLKHSSLGPPRVLVQWVSGGAWECALLTGTWAMLLQRRLCTAGVLRPRAEEQRRGDPGGF